MSEEVSKEVSKNDLYRIYKNSIVELFNYAESCNIAQFFLSLMPPPRELPTPAGGMLYEVPDMEIQEAFETHRYLDDAIRDKQLDAKIRTRLILLVFFHLLEADRWHSILGNVLNVIIGHNYVGNLFEDDSLGEKINGIRGLLKACQKRGILLSIRKTYSDICNDNVRVLRNAFFHSHYTLAPDGNLLITKRLMESQRQFKNYFKFDEVQDIHQGIVTFLTGFAKVRKERLGKFQGRGVDLDHEVDWIETMHKPIVKRCKICYRLRGRFSYRPHDSRWHFQGQLAKVVDN